MKAIKLLDAADEREERIMKNVKGWKMHDNLYSTRWLPPMIEDVDE